MQQSAEYLFCNFGETAAEKVSALGGSEENNIGTWFWSLLFAVDGAELCMMVAAMQPVYPFLTFKASEVRNFSPPASDSAEAKQKPSVKKSCFSTKKQSSKCK